MGEIGQIPNHQVKVDNWPLFFLQRLYHFYRKKSHCDLTLLFSTLHSVKSIKVHKLVLHACTDYFESLDIMKDSEHGEFLQLSNEMHPDVIIPIISFMYTGKLEFPVTLQPRLYEAATKLRMTILTKLLDVQPNQTTSKQSSQEAVSKVVQSEMQLMQSSMENQNEPEATLSAVDVTQPSATFTSLPSSKQPDDSIGTITPTNTVVASQTKPNFKPEVTVIQRAEVTPIKTIVTKAKVTKTNLGVHFTTVSPKPRIVDPSLPPTLPGRKLPVWKRKVPLSGSQLICDNFQNISGSFVSPESQKPTRFEWDEDLNDPTVLRPVEEAPKILAYDGGVKVHHPIILDGDVDSAREVSNDSSKRSSDGSCSESPPYKRSKSDLQDMKEYGKQQQLRNEIICSEENSEDMMDTDDLYGPCDDDADDVEGFNQSNVNSSTPKPILKSVSKPESPMALKRVRFSLEGKENNQQQNEPAADFTAVKQSEIPVTKQKIILPMNVGSIQSGKHHVKIVSEVLRKYPNLAKRENIKLRVVSKKPAAVPPAMQQVVEGDPGTGNKSSSSLVSYIFLTNRSSGDLLTVKEESTEREKVFDVENKTGPWICHVCDELNPLQFDSYYTYRRHLVEVHALKIDARICEYCGMKNNKRNHLLYHLYIKHGIEPPAHVSFPKCPECDYIALSEALLIKHKLSHDSKSLTCYVCNVMFKTHACMEKHLLSNWHKSRLREVSSVPAHYPCPFCEVRFESGNELKDHIETCHQSQRVSQRGGKQIYRCPYCEGIFGDGDNLGKHIVSLHWGKNKQSSNQSNETEPNEPHSGQQLEYGEEQEASREGSESSVHPSPLELESLSSVASGIATSLNLVGNEQTVVYYDQRAEGQDIGREATVVSGDECRDYIVAGSEDVDSQQTNEEEKPVDIENEDSNSRMSNAEEVHPVSCSDHDYTEPHGDDNLRQMIPVQQVENQIPVQETPVIQQILPDQRLVFSTQQGNVVFQSPCVTLPQQVLLTPGKMVLPRIATNEQNVILSHVIPQTGFILSNPILQPTGEIVEDGSNTIVFASQEPAENIQTVDQYQMEPSVQDPGEKPPDEMEIFKNDEQEEKVEMVEQVKEIQIEGALEEASESSQSLAEEAGTGEVEREDGSTSESPPEESKQARVETAKIVDDWDETNDSQQNVERRSDDGPSRPEFF